MGRVPEGYTDCWTPIESNPEIFTGLARSIGLSKSLIFQDIWALDAESIAFLPRPVHALVLVFPTEDKYEQNRAARETHQHYSTEDRVIWFKQTIYNACGLYGLLHAVCNGEARNQIMPDTLLSSIWSAYFNIPSAERSNLLSSPELEKEYLKAAQEGESTVPEDAADEVDFHYTSFVKSNGQLYELDGDLSGPIDLGALNEADDLVSEAALAPIRRSVEAHDGEKIGFSMLALVPTVET